MPDTPRAAYLLPHVLPSEARQQLKRDAWAVLPIQLIVGGALLWVIGVPIASFGANYDGGIEAVSLVVVPAIVAALTEIGCFVIGLPLRTVPRLRVWWMSHGWVTVCVILLGGALIAASYFVGTAGYVHFPRRDGNGFAQTEFEPDAVCLAFGWCLLTLGLVHAWWPLAWRPRAARERRRELLRTALIRTDGNLDSTPVERDARA